MTDETGLPAAKDEIGLLDLALVLAENLGALILVPLAAGLLALGIGFLITPTFTATARILPPLQQQSASASLAAQFGALTGLAGAAAGIKNPADQYVAFLRSGPILDAMIARFKLQDASKGEYLVDARRSMLGRTKVTAGVKDGIISIEVDDADPKRAAEMANAYIEELRNLMTTLAVTEPAKRRLFFETELKQVRDSLTRSEVALRASGISEASLKTVPQSALEAIARIRAQITAQEIRLASMRASMTESNPQLKTALQELAALRTELLRAEQSGVAKAGGEGEEYIARFREFKYQETLFELMAKQYELARLDEAREGAVIQVLETAYPPERKSRPQKAVNAVITTLAVFFLLIPFFLVRHAVRNMATESESGEKLRRLRGLLRLRRA